MMHLIATILQELFSQLELNPASVTEVEIIAGISPMEWWIHLQPAKDWYACVNVVRNQWLVSSYDYITE